MGRSQLQYNRRARGRGRGGGRGAAGAPAGRGGGGGGVASAKASQQAALRKLPSNQDRFQRGGGGGSGGGGEGRLRSDEEGGDDLREYALSTDSRLGHRHVLAEEGADEDSGDLSSLSLDLGALAEGLCCLPAHVRLGGVDPALTEGLMYRQGYPPSNEGEASPPSPPKSLVELDGSMTSASMDKHPSSATTLSVAPPPPSFEPPLEALLGLDLSSSSTGKETKKEVAKPAAAPFSTSSSALPSDLDDLLNMDLSARKSAGGGANSSDSGKKTTMRSDEDDDVLNDLLGQPQMPTSSLPAAPSKAKAKKLSALDAGDY